MDGDSQSCISHLPFSISVDPQIMEDKYAGRKTQVEEISIFPWA